MHSSREKGGNEQTAYELVNYYYHLALACSLWLLLNAQRFGKMANTEVLFVVLKFSELHWVVGIGAMKSKAGRWSLTLFFFLSCFSFFFFGEARVLES